VNAAAPKPLESRGAFRNRSHALEAAYRIAAVNAEASGRAYEVGVVMLSGGRFTLEGSPAAKQDPRAQLVAIVAVGRQTRFPAPLRRRSGPDRLPGDRNPHPS